MNRKLWVIAAAAIVFSVVGAASAPAASDNPNNVAAKICQAEKHADPAAFEATYGAKHTMRECKRAHRDEGIETVNNASQECEAEQAADPTLFQETYGSNGNGRNAFGKCVSSKVKTAAAELAAEEAQTFADAAQECRAERNEDAAAFQETYGTNENKRNAFGKCVSTKVREAETA